MCNQPLLSEFIRGLVRLAHDNFLQLNAFRWATCYSCLDALERHAEVSLAEPFISSLEQDGSVLSHYRLLEVHLDASKREEHADFRLAVALNPLHSHPDGTNPHSYEAMKLVVNGKFLYARYSYKLVSPAVAKQAGAPLKKLATGKLDQEDQARVQYKVNSTEKTVAKELLGIRGLNEVSFSGGGRLEGLFAQVLKDTVVQEPGTSTREPAPDKVPAHTLELFRKGIINSATYQAIPPKSPGYKDPQSSERDSPGLPIDNIVNRKRRAMPRRSNSTTLADKEELELDMANMKPMNAVDMNHHKSDWSNWSEFRALTDDGLVVELGWTI